MTFVFLIAAIISEVTATLSLRMASQDGSDKRWLAVVTVGYLAAFAS
ncbi:UNVERIFIED_ORG: multidrug transporter EmrE-like cation transporter [Rhodococcus erythropolis]